MPLFDDCKKQINGSVDVHVNDSVVEFKKTIAKVLLPNSGLWPPRIDILSADMSSANRNIWCTKMKQYLVEVENWPPHLIACGQRRYDEDGDLRLRPDHKAFLTVNWR